MSEHVVIVASDGVADLTPVAKFMAARQMPGVPFVSFNR